MAMPQAENGSSTPSELQKILKNRSLTTLYQPIVELTTQNIIGYDAIIIGPEAGELQSAAALFDQAVKEEKLLDLDQCCFDTALISGPALAGGQKLFIEIQPQTLAYDVFKKLRLKMLLGKTALHPQQIVFKITYRNFIQSWSQFAAILQEYKNMKFGIALDCIGRGYADLYSLCFLPYDYVKIDRKIINGIYDDNKKRQILDTLLDLAGDSATIIADGVNSEEDLSVIITNNIYAAQGEFLAAPCNPPLPLSEVFLNKVDRLLTIERTTATLTSARETGKKAGNSNNILKPLAKSTPTVSPTLTVSEAETIFEADPSLRGIVVVQENIPVGLIMKEKLYVKLGTTFGVSLYRKRQVKELMDAAALILSADTSVEIAASRAMAREETSIYDLIIVTENDSYIGIVSIVDLVLSMLV